MRRILQNIIEEYGINHYYYGIKKYKLDDELMSRTKFLSTKSEMKERFYCVLNDININCECKVVGCSQKPKFKNINSGYHKFCSSTCSEIYKRETMDDDGVLLTKVIGNKIRNDKKQIMSNENTKGQNARAKQLKQQLKIDPITGLTYTAIIAKKGVQTLIANNSLQLRGQKIKNIKLHNYDENGKNGYDRAGASIANTKKKQYQLLQIENNEGLDNYFLYFFINTDNNLIKVGVSKNYINRKKYLESKLRCNLTIHDVYFGKQPEILKAEYRLHNMLMESQVKYSTIDGKWEWFNYSYFLDNKCKIDTEINKFNMEKYNEAKVII